MSEKLPAAYIGPILARGRLVPCLGTKYDKNWQQIGGDWSLKEAEQNKAKQKFEARNLISPPKYV